MKIFLLSAVLILSFSLAPKGHAQYVPLAHEGARYVFFSTNENVPGHYLLEISGDSVIDGRTYKVVTHYSIISDAVEREDLTPPYMVDRNSELYALVRDDIDAHQVYAYFDDHWDCNDGDQLAYDFSKVVNDTMLGCLFPPTSFTSGDTVYSTVEAIETIDFFGNQHRKFTIQKEYIEGVGEERQLLAHVNEFFVTTVFSYLHMYCRDSDPNCDFSLVSNTVERREAIPLNCAPNPTQGSITIDGSALAFANGQTRIAVVDFMGRTRRMEQIESPNGMFELNLGDLEQGVYLLQISDQLGIIGQSRVVKQ